VAVRLSVFYRSLAQLYGAGMPWPQALEAALGGRDRRGGLDPAWDAVLAGVGAGRPLSDVIADLVPAIDRAGLRAAEASGRMEELLQTLATRHEDLERRALAERTAMAYPLLMAHLAAGLAAIPDLVAGRTGAALCWVLAVLVPTHLWLLARRRLRAAEVSGLRPAGWLAFVRTRAFTEEADARAIEALGWLHDAGVPPLEALPLAAAAGVGGRAADDLVDGWNEVREGRSITRAFSRLPDDVRSALLTGETTGHLAEACARSARTLAESAAHRREVALARLRPLMTLALGILVGLRVITFYAQAYGEVFGLMRGRR